MKMLVWVGPAASFSRLGFGPAPASPRPRSALHAALGRERARAPTVSVPAVAESSVHWKGAPCPSLVLGPHGGSLSQRRLTARSLLDFFYGAPGGAIHSVIDSSCKYRAPALYWTRRWVPDEPDSSVFATIYQSVPFSRVLNRNTVLNVLCGL